MFAPLAIFAFNRTGTLEKVLASLARCENLTGGGRRACYVFIDGARTDGSHDDDVAKVEAVRGLVERFRTTHFPTLRIVTRACNLGTAANIRQGVSQMLDQEGRVVVVEDDILVSRFFLDYMDEALEKYNDDPRIWCVNGYHYRVLKVPRCYPYDVYLTPRHGAWGWGTWKDRWDAVDFTLADWPAFKREAGNMERVDRAGIDVKGMLDAQFAGTLGTWDVQCTYHIVKNGMWAVEPRLALTKNIGFGAGGIHCSFDDTLVSRARYYDFKPMLPSLGELQSPPEKLSRQFPYMVISPFLGTRIVRKLQRCILRLGPRHDEAVRKDWT